MKLFGDEKYIGDCHSCGEQLYYRWGQNVYSGGPFYCGKCGENVTEDIYGENKVPEPPKETKE